MLSVELAKKLRDAGLTWEPRRFDYFHIPDRNLDDERFIIADLSIDVQNLATGIAAITFNGAVEWSLDYILTQDVVWVPSEHQLRTMLGRRFVGLNRADGGLRVSITIGGDLEAFDADTADDAYGMALLAVLEHEPDMFRSPRP